MTTNYCKECGYEVASACSQHPSAGVNAYADKRYTLDLDEVRDTLCRQTEDSWSKIEAWIAKSVEARAFDPTWDNSFIDLDDVVESYRIEQHAKRYTWTIEISIKPNMVADGIDLSDPRQLERMLESTFPYLMGHERFARVVSAPDAEEVAREQGYKSAADKASRKKGW